MTESLPSIETKYTGEIQRTQEEYSMYNALSENPFFPKEKLTQHIDAKRFLDFFTEKIGNNVLRKIFIQKGLPNTTSEIFVFMGRNIEEKHVADIARLLHPEDRYFLDSQMHFYLLPREYLSSENLQKYISSIHISSEKFLPEIKKQKFQKKVQATIDVAKNMGMKKSYLNNLSIALQLFIHN